MSAMNSQIFLPKRVSGISKSSNFLRNRVPKKSFV